MKRRMTLTNGAVVRDLWLLCSVAIVVGLGGSAAHALDPIGPPISRIQEDQFGIGADLSFSWTDIELSHGTWSGRVDGDDQTGDTGKFAIKDFQTVKLYSTLGYGFAENYEAFVRLGAAKAEFGDSMWAQGEEFDSGVELAMGAGVRATFYEFYQPNLKIGGIAQVNWSRFDGKQDSAQWPAPDFVEISLAEAQVAVGVTYGWRDRVTLFAGPFVHFLYGDVEHFSNDFKASWDIDEGPILGGYLGAIVDVGTIIDVGWDCVVNVEYQHSADANAFGAGLIYRY